MKRVIITFETDEDFKQHLEKQANKNSRTRSDYIRRALKIQSNYKEKKLI